MEALMKLTETLEFLAFSEEDAREFVDQMYSSHSVENFSIKYKKPTAKKSEHWIVEVKIRHAAAEDFIYNE